MAYEFSPQNYDSPKIPIHLLKNPKMRFWLAEKFNLSQFISINRIFDQIFEMTSNDLLLGMTPSSMALSLINCNPIVANDPILNSSLTSLATQILHMEHLIQVYMVSSN